MALKRLAKDEVYRLGLGIGFGGFVLVVLDRSRVNRGLGQTGLEQFGNVGLLRWVNLYENAVIDRGVLEKATTNTTALSGLLVQHFHHVIHLNINLTRSQSNWISKPNDAGKT